MTYGSKDGFVEYHEARGRVIPFAWDDDSINASLLVASEWIDNMFGSQFSGQKTGGYTQEREWPRQGASAFVNPVHNFANTDIPDEVVKATYEAAWRDASKPGSLQVDFTPGKYKSVTVEGAISVDYKLFDNASEVQTQIAIIGSLLAPLLCGPGTFSGLSGGSDRV